MASVLTPRAKQLIRRADREHDKRIRSRRDRDAALVGIVQELQRLESLAHAHQLLVTAQAINNAKNACGWERAGNITAAARAARGEDA
jgi:hypothetical protein